MMMRRRIAAAAAAVVLAVGVLPAVTTSESQAATVCKGTVSNSPLKGRGKTYCTGMPKGTYQQAKLWCKGYSKPTYGNWAKNGAWSYAYCPMPDAIASYVDVRFKK